MLDEVKNVIICRLLNKRFFRVMNARKSLMVMNGLNFAKAPLSEGSLNDSSRRLKIKINSQHLDLNLNMKKNTELAIDGIVSNKTEITLTMPNFDVNEDGACHEL
jgi:hypothetical protein